MSNQNERENPGSIPHVDRKVARADQQNWRRRLRNAGLAGLVGLASALGVSSQSKATDFEPPSPISIEEEEPLPTEDPEVLVIGGSSHGNTEEPDVSTLANIVIDSAVGRGIEPHRITIAAFTETGNNTEGVQKLIFGSETGAVDMVMEQIAQSVSQADRELLIVFIGHHSTSQSNLDDSYYLHFQNGGQMSTPQFGVAIAEGLSRRGANAPNVTIRLVFEGCENGNVVLPVRQDNSESAPYPFDPINLFDNVQAELNRLGQGDLKGFNIIIMAPSVAYEETNAQSPHTLIDHLFGEVIVSTIEDGIVSWVPPQDSIRPGNKPQYVNNNMVAVTGNEPPTPEQIRRSGIYGQSSTLSQSISVVGYPRVHPEHPNTFDQPLLITNYEIAPTRPISLTLTSGSNRVTSIVGQSVVLQAIPGNSEKQALVKLTLNPNETGPITGTLTFEINGTPHTIYIDSRNDSLPIGRVTLIEEKSAVSVRHRPENPTSPDVQHHSTLRFTHAYSEPLTVRLIIHPKSGGFTSVVEALILPEELVGASDDNPVDISLSRWLTDWEIFMGKIRISGPAGDEIAAFQLPPGENNDFFSQADQIPTQTGEAYLNKLTYEDRDIFPIPLDGLTKSIIINSRFSVHSLPKNMEITFYTADYQPLSSFTTPNGNLEQVSLPLPPGARYVSATLRSNFQSQYKITFSSESSGSEIYLPILMQPVSDVLQDAIAYSQRAQKRSELRKTFIPQVRN